MQEACAMTDWRTEFDEALLRVYSYTHLDNRMPKEYLPGVALLPREMHTIEVILHHPGVNTTELSRITGIPKGTVSKMTRQLEERGLLEHFRRNGNRKEVHYRGTALGRRVFDAHTDFHRVNGRAFYDRFDALAEDQKALIVDTLVRYADYMKEYCDSRAARHGCRHTEERGETSD